MHIEGMHVAKRTETSSPQIIISQCDLYGKFLDIVQNINDSSLFIGLVFHVGFYFNAVKKCLYMDTGMQSLQTSEL
jgi:hypothetical protein